MNSDDESLWETLEHDEPPEPTGMSRMETRAQDPSPIRSRTAPAATSRDTSAASTTTPAPSTSQASGSSSGSSSLPPRIQAIQRRLETRSRLRKSLVEHPMQLVWSHFFVHFSRELWQLDVSLRFALVLIFVGATLKIILLSTWYLWYPKLVLACLLLVIPWCFLHPQMLQDNLASFLATFSSSPMDIADALGQLEPAQLRKLATALLFIPTVLEMRTMHFLSQIQQQTDQHDSSDSFLSYWSLYNLGMAGIILSVMLYLLQFKHCAPRECTQKGLLVLYGSALLVTLVQLNVYNMMVLGAPFMVATGVLILANHANDNDDDDDDDDMEWLARAVRRALRLTLRDVLASVSETVQQDEMLQLAMLRWIVDYWSNNSNNNGNNDPEPRTATTRSPTDETHADSRRSGVTSSQQRSESRSSSSNLALARPHHELQWDELWSMLNMTTVQMASEVNSLQHVAVGGASESSNSERLPQSSTQQSGHHSARSSTYATPPMGSAASSASSSAANNYDSVQNLQSMLSCMDIDDKAKPAVMAYKRGVEAFPPSRNMAVLLSVARRCPALLTVLFQIVFGVSGSLTSTVILFPFIFFEMLRIQSWSDACQGSSIQTELSTDIGETPSSFGNLDPMTILLSGDCYSARNPPTLLVVWRNMCDSVSALEVGLTAARCVQTTVVAVDFAGNILSLAQFGLEVSQQGWMYGLAVVLKEMLVLHTNTSGSRSPDAKYTNAVRDALSNSQRVSRNVRVLIEEEDVGRVLLPMFSIIPVLLGQGWLWAGQGPPTQTSTVEITELEDSDNILAVPDAPTVDSVYRSSVRSMVLEEAASPGNAPLLSQGPNETETGSPRQPSIPSAPQESTINETECLTDLSTIMELIAACDEQGLLSEGDKNSFCEKLATVGGKSGPSVEWLEGSTRTLQGLLDLHSDDTVSSIEQPSQQEEPCAFETPPERSVPAEIQKDNEMPKPSGRDARQQSDRDTEDASDFLPLDAGDNVTRQVVGPQHENTSPPVGSAEPCDLKAGGHATRTESGVPEAEANRKPPRSDDEEDNLWLKVGGGIAVLGAVVVGGVALALGQQGNDQSPSQSRRQNRSTVQIEELSDNEEGGDDWVAVPSSRSI